MSSVATIKTLEPEADLVRKTSVFALQGKVVVIYINSHEILLHPATGEDADKPMYVSSGIL